MKGKSGNKRIIFQANLVLYLTIIDAVYFSDICNHFTQTDPLHSEGFIFILIKQKEKWSHKLTDRFYPVNLIKTGACLCLDWVYTTVASMWSKQWWTLETRFSTHLPESGAAQLEDSKLFFRRNWPNLQPSVAQTHSHFRHCRYFIRVDMSGWRREANNQSQAGSGVQLPWENWLRLKRRREHIQEPLKVDKYKKHYKHSNSSTPKGIETHNRTLTSARGTRMKVRQEQK